MQNAESWITDALAELREAGLLRTMPRVDSAPGRTVTINGRECINLASNNPLDLAADARVITAAQKAMQDYGCGSSASRLVCGNLPVHRELEEKLAAFKGCEAAAVFPTGYMANLGTISALVGKGDRIIVDKLSHASIIDGARLSGARVRTYAHNNTARLKELLARDEANRTLVVTDSLFSMDGDLAPLCEIAELCEQSGAMLMVDEAHATGVLGPNGRGALAALKLENRVTVAMGTLSKAVGALGGFVCGSRELVSYIHNRARAFIYTTGIPAAMTGAALEALRILEETDDPGRVAKERANELWQRLTAAGHVCNPPGAEAIPPAAHILPLIVGEADDALALSAKLLEQNIFAPAIRPPTVPPGTARLRLSTMNSHTAEDLERIVAALNYE